MTHALIAVFLLFATPSRADSCSTQTPPSPASNMAPSSPCNALPPGEATARYPTFGGALSVTRFGTPVESMPLPPPAPARPHAQRAATPRDQPVLRGAE